jgi:hypothetical protein
LPREPIDIEVRRILLREKLQRPLAPAHWFFDTFSYKSD